MSHIEIWKEWNGERYDIESAERPDDDEFECAGCLRIFDETENINGFCKKCDKGE